MNGVFILGKKAGGDLVSDCLNGSGCKTKSDCEKCMEWADKACRLYADEKKYDSCANPKQTDCCKAEKAAVDDIKKKIQTAGSEPRR